MQAKEFSSLKLPDEVYPFVIKEVRLHVKDENKSWRIDGEITVGRNYAFTFFLPYDPTPKNRHGGFYKAVFGKDITIGEITDDTLYPAMLRGKQLRLVLAWDIKRERMAVQSILPFKEGVQTIGEAKLGGYIG